jgi:hypothetical protein
MKDHTLKIIAAMVMVCGMVGSILLTYAIWEGYYLFLAGSSLGAIWCYHKKTYTLMALDIFYTCANCLGIYNQIL